MAKFFIERPIFAIVLSVLITLGGLIAMFNLPIAQYPQITPPRINVSTSYTGANAEAVEQAVTQVIEQQINGVENAVAMQSTSGDNGWFSLDVQFELGTNADTAAVQTQNRVSQASAQLPQEVVQAGLTTKKTTPDSVMYFSLISPNQTYDNTFLKNYGSIHLIEDIKRVKGVGTVNEYGSDFAVRIWLQADKMARLGITTTDIYTAIKAQNVQAAAGSIGQRPSVPQQEFQYSARVKGRLAEPEEFEKIIVLAKPDGSFVRLADVARVEFASKEYNFNSDVNGRESVVFAINLTSDANALTTVAQVREVIEEASKKFPTDLEYKIVVDNTRFVKESLKEVLITFGEALVLVILIVFIFLQSWRATLIPMLAVPVSLIGTFAAFLVLGFSINTLTLFAMVLAIGIVVDDAIVVVEAVEHHMRYSGLTPRQATYRAMEEVSGPVIAIACVLISVFLPVAFFGGTVGVLYKQFAITISIAVALSAVVALTLTPALCALLLQPHSENQHQGFLAKFFDRFNNWFENVLNRYSNGVRRAIRRTGICVAGLLILVVLSGAMFRMLPSSFVPNEDQGFFFAVVQLPEAASANRTRHVANKVGEVVRTIPGVQDAIVITGFDIMAGAMKPNAAIVIGAMKPWAERTSPDLHVSKAVLQAMLKTKDIPEATVMTFNAPALPGIGALGGVTMMLEAKGGASITDMDQTTQQFLAAARQRPEISMIYSNFRADTPGYQFDVDREKAEKLGIPVQNVFTALQTFLGGLQVNDVNKFGRTYKVVMQAEPQFRSDIDAARFLYLRSNTGTMVPLSTLIKPTTVNGPSTIKHYNGFRSTQINATPAPGYSSGQVMKALEEVSAQVLPASFAYEWTDQSREEKISGGRAPIIFGFSLLFSFLCLAALYESWRIPFAVLLSVPTGLFGSLLFQYARQMDINVYMQIGLIMLIGLAAKNAILIVEFAKLRIDQGDEPAEAAIAAARLRLRPILMTSFAFIIGCLPLAIAEGAGAGARSAMGTAVVGGMLIATLLGIFLVPVLFVLIERRKKRSNIPPLQQVPTVSDTH